MQKSIKKSLLSIICFVFAISFAFAVVLCLPKDKVIAEEYTGFTLSKYATVETNDNGDKLLKFTTKVGSDFIANNYSTVYTFGTLIFPSDNGSVDTTRSPYVNNETLDCINIIAKSSQRITEGFSYNASILFDKETLTSWVLSQKPELEGDEEGLETALNKVYNNLFAKSFTAVSYIITDIDFIYSDACSTSINEVEGFEDDDGEVEHKHNLIYHEANASTCVSEGNIEYWSCSCGKLFTDNTATTEIIDEDSVVIQKTGHNYINLKKTLTQHWLECSCGDKTTPEDHKGGVATCTEKAKCSVCSVEYGVVNGHKYHAVVTKPTCLEQGYTTYTCYCGDSYVSDYVQKLKHTEVIDWGLNPTCTENGLTSGKHCSKCNEVLIEQKVIEALGHSEITTMAIKPTCTETGLTEGSYCSECGEVLVEQEVVEALGHTGEGLNCDVCGTQIKEYILNFSITNNNATVIGYTGTPVNLVIPSTYQNYPVTTIADGAFYECWFLASVEIPDSVTSIGAKAFSGSDLKTITFGDNSQLKSIGHEAFQDCNFTSIEIPDGVTCIDYWTFAGCSSLASVEIPNSVTSIGEMAFYLCNSLEIVTFGNDSQLNSIGFSAFYSCNSLKNIEIPDTVTSIAFNAFSACESLVSVKIPNSVTDISYVFAGCSSLTSITFGGTVEEWNSIKKDNAWDGVPATEVICSDGRVAI